MKHKLMLYLETAMMMWRNVGIVAEFVLPLLNGIFLTTFWRVMTVEQVSAKSILLTYHGVRIGYFS
jgi:hypothetical protein